VDEKEFVQTQSKVVVQPPPPSVRSMQSVVVVQAEESFDILPLLVSKTDENVIIPLRGISVKAVIVGFVADVEISQRFYNQSDNPIEATFKFENHESALTNFEVEVNDKIIKGVCKSKEEAFNEYEDSISQGHGGYLVEQGKEDNVTIINIGNFPPQCECRLTIRYVSELNLEDGVLQFNLPITRTRIIESTDNENQKLKDKVPSGISLEIDMMMPSIIANIVCESHAIEQEINGKKSKN